MVINTRHTAFVVEDLEKFILFYQALGLKIISRKFEEGNYIDNLVGLSKTKLEWVKLCLPDNSIIEILKYHSHPDKSNIKRQAANRIGCSHIAFSVEKIEKTIEIIINYGGYVQKGFQISPDGKVKVAYCYDFEGNILEIVENIK